MTAVKKLREHAPPHLTEHMRLVSKHAKALQLSQDSDRDYDDKAKAYTHKEYEALKKDVQSNVNTRKQVDISAKVVQCYVDHMTDNAKAKACADKARKSDVSIWNIDGGKLSSCASTASLEDAFGPLSWTATKKNCAAKVAKSEEEVETRESKKEDDEEETLLEELEF